MMLQRILAYLLLVSFFVLDALMRKGKTARSLEKTESDNKSTVFIGLTFFIVLVLSLLLNGFGWGTFQDTTVSRIGLGIMVLGLLIRLSSMRTLSRYYTRTLVTVNQQELVKRGVYKIIRHPGYLGTILLWSAAGLAMQNYIIFIVATVLILIAYFYRIQNEEKMLTEQFQEQYTAYKKHSWRLFPLLW